VDKENLGRLERVVLRDVWENEAGDFTPWLGREENIKLLGDTIGLELQVEAEEKPVGPFSADILCRDMTDNSWVLIENQLERTDHTHLGQLMTYAAGLEAVSIIWVAERFTDEHRAALDWLNDITQDNINLFGLEIELWKIGDSATAPKLNVVCKPNDWSKTVRWTAERKELSETQMLQLDFWTRFNSFLKDNGSMVNPTKPSPRHWMSHSIGRSGFSLSSILSAWDSELGAYGGELRVELVIDHKQSKTFFAMLEGRRKEIEEEIGGPLTWYNPENKRMCRVYLRSSTDITDRNLWGQHYQWLKEKLEAFYRTFAPIVKELDVSEYEGGPGIEDGGDI